MNFSNTVIILTSNLGAQFLMSDLSSSSKGTLSEATREKVMGAVRKHLLPEFINRLDDIVIFQPLTRPQLREIVRIAMQSVGKRLQSQDIEVKISDQACDWIAEKSYDVAYGARPLRRFVEKVKKLEMRKDKKFFLTS